MKIILCLYRNVLASFRGHAFKSVRMKGQHICNFKFLENKIVHVNNR